MRRLDAGLGASPIDGSGGKNRKEMFLDRIGVWGASYCGGHVLVLGAIDKRIRCVATQVPMVSGLRWEWFSETGKSRAPTSRASAPRRC